MRPIDGDALEQFFLHECHRLQEYLKSEECDKEEKEYIRTFLPTVEWARKTVHHVTTINPEDLRPKGKWEDRPTGRYGQWQTWCTNCGQHNGIGGTEKNRHKPFCPNCGAKMEE